MSSELKEPPPSTPARPARADSMRRRTSRGADAPTRSRAPSAHTASRRRKKNRYLPVIIVGLGVAVVGSGAFALVRTFLNSAPNPPKQVVQEVHLIRPPPPPPDLPPPPPPPPEEKVDVQEPQKQPDPTPSDEPPPSEQLGLDAAGTAGGDAFGLAARPGGRDITAVGGSAFAWYSNALQAALRDCLQDDNNVRGTVRVKLWMREDGSVERVRMVESTGDHGRDKAIENRLAGCRPAQAPPANTPEPITVRIAARG